MFDAKFRKPGTIGERSGGESSVGRTYISRVSYGEPFAWWGPVWEPPPARTLLDLLRSGTLTPVTAGLLWGGLARRASLVVAAGPRGAGKTTLLTALLACYPETSRRLYLRGCYESFAFLDDPAVVPSESLLLVNELSPHLPAYLWGPGVRRLFQAAPLGYTFAATAHATSIEDLIGMLAGYPLQTTVPELAAINLVVLMQPVSHDGRWGVDEVWAVARGSDRGLTVDCLADRSGLRQTGFATDSLPSFVPGAGEVARRAEFLAHLVSQGEDSSGGHDSDLRAELHRFTG